jgi:hypothetical protein
LWSVAVTWSPGTISAAFVLATHMQAASLQERLPKDTWDTVPKPTYVTPDPASPVPAQDLGGVFPFRLVLWSKIIIWVCGKSCCPKQAPLALSALTRVMGCLGPRLMEGNQMEGPGAGQHNSSEAASSDLTQSHLCIACGPLACGHLK